MSKKSTQASKQDKKKSATKKTLEKKPSVSKPWLKSYPPMVSAEIDKLEHNSLGELFENSVSKYGSSPAFTCMGKTINYSQLLGQSSNIGAWLKARGLQKGDRVAIMMPNILQYPAVLVGILRAGMTVVNVNPLYTPRELEHQLKDSGAKAIFILENFAITLQKVIAKTDVQHVVVTSMGDQMGGIKALSSILSCVMSKKWCRNGRCPLTPVLKRYCRMTPVVFPLRKSMAAILHSYNILAAPPVFPRALP